MKERQSEMGKTPSDGGRNEVRVFENAQFGQIRTAQGASGEPLFCLADLCKVINVTNHRNVAKRIDQDGVRRMDIIDSMGRGTRTMVLTSTNVKERR